MRNLFLLSRNKKGLSNLVAYVLLISMTISLSILVYGWLKFYVGQEEVETCPEGVNLIIENYECSYDSNGNLVLTMNLKNKGLFSVGGYILRVHDRADAEFGFYVIDDIGDIIMPGQRFSKSYDISDYNEGEIGDLTLVEVQPYVGDAEKINCESRSVQKVECD